MTKAKLIAIAALVGLVSAAMTDRRGEARPVDSERVVYVGTYTGETSHGIYAFRFDDSSGLLTALGLAAETPSPSFLTSSANGRFVFAVNELQSFRGSAGEERDVVRGRSGHREAHRDQRATDARRGAHVISRWITRVATWRWPTTAVEISRSFRSAPMRGCSRRQVWFRATNCGPVDPRRPHDWVTWWASMPTTGSCSPPTKDWTGCSSIGSMRRRES